MVNECANGGSDTVKVGELTMALVPDDPLLAEPKVFYGGAFQGSCTKGRVSNSAENPPPSDAVPHLLSRLPIDLSQIIPLPPAPQSTSIPL